MIFVTVGTTDFDPLVERMDSLAAGMAEEIVAQVGRGTYLPTNMRFFRFADSLEPWLAQARVVVSHGGLGTVVEVLRRGIPLIALSNPDRYDRHQDDLLGTMESRGHLIWCRGLEDLAHALEQAERRQFTRYVAPTCDIPRVIRQHLGLLQR